MSAESIGNNTTQFKSINKMLRRWNMRRILKRNPIPHDVWNRATQQIAVLRGLNAVQLARLRELTTWFLHRKYINGAHGLEVTLEMRVAVAAQACLLILNLDTDCFDDWVEVILYPGAFRVNHVEMDDIGLVHDHTSDLTGESWVRGPVILSWDDIVRDIHDPLPGHNVVLHEFAHKLDGIDGVANGLPPLHRDMSVKEWAEDFSQAYEALCRQVEAGEEACIDPYAAASPAEFFAVASEYFFTAPDILKNCFPGVHRQLTQFYRPPR